MEAMRLCEILIKNGKKICSSRDIANITKTDYLKIISKLTNTRWILPIDGFRGIYYVRDAEEREEKVLKLSNFTILVQVLNKYLGSEWYFGRITALSLSGRIDQPVSTYYVINKKKSKKIVSSLFGKIIFVKTEGDINRSCGIIKENYQGAEYQICSIERNISDYIYFYVHGYADRGQITNLYHKHAIPRESLVEMALKCYPKKSAIKMLSLIKELKK